MPRDDAKPLEERVDNLANVVFSLNRSVTEELIPQLEDFSTTADVQDRISGVERRLKWFVLGMSALVLVVALTFTTVGFIIASNIYNTQREETKKRAKAFCGLVYLFDQSVKVQGHENQLGPFQKAYDDWKKDVNSSNCPKRPDILPNQPQPK